MSVLESVTDDIPETPDEETAFLLDAPSDTPDWEWVAVCGSWILSLLIYIGGSYIYVYTPHATPAINTDVLLPNLIPHARPEPLEKTLYVSGLLCIPTLPPFFFFCISWVLTKLPRAAKLCTTQWMTIIRDILVVIVLIFWLASLGTWSRYPNVDAYLIASGVLALFVPFVLQLRPVKRSWIIGVILAAALGLTWYLMLFDDVRLITTRSIHHFNLLIGAILHVAQGRTILVDNTSQYGVLYPYIAAMCIAPFGFSVWTISQWFASLGMIWYALIGLAIGKRFGYNTWGFVVFIFGLIAVSQPLCCGFNFLTHSFFGLEEIILKSSIGYQQYFPIRTFWCGVFFWLVFQCNGKNRRYWIALGYALAGAALLWNQDTGIVILLTWSGVWAMNRLADRSHGIAHSLSGIMLHAFFGILTAAASIGAYLVFAKCRSGVWPDLQEFMQYQRVFYELGFFMLPMPLWEIWQPVILIYAVTAAWCVRKALQGQWDNDARWLFFVAIYGLGAFSYYQGRSAITSLSVMLFPVLLISFYWAALGMEQLPELSLRILWKQPQLRWKFLQIMGFSIFVMFSFFSYVRQVPALVHLAHHIHSEKPRPGIKAGFENLRAEVHGRKVVAIGNADALFCMETHCESLLPFSSIIEVCLKEHVLKVQQAIDRPEVEYIILDSSGGVKLPAGLDFHAFPYSREVRVAHVCYRLLAKQKPAHSTKEWTCSETAPAEEKAR
jgi:hypothetical protein